MCMTQSLQIDLKFQKNKSISFLQNVEYLLEQRRRIIIIFSDFTNPFSKENFVELLIINKSSKIFLSLIVLKSRTTNCNFLTFVYDIDSWKMNMGEASNLL